MAFSDQIASFGGVPSVIISVALMLFSGFLMTRITKLLRLPNVTAYIVAGILIGPYCLNFVPQSIIDGIRRNIFRRKIMLIETQRLILREMTDDDFEALYRVLVDSDIMQHYPYTFDENRVRNWIMRNIERYRIFGFGLWAVCLKETGEIIGDCGLTMQSINGQIKPEIGYHIRADQQRKGFAKEAAIAVRDWTFRNTPFNIIYSYMLHTNEPSCRTAIAYGCRQVNEFNDEANGMTKVFAITRKEWGNQYRSAQQIGIRINDDLPTLDCKD